MKRGFVVILLAVGCRDLIGIDDPVHEHPADAARGDSGKTDATSRICPHGCTSCDAAGTCIIDCRTADCSSSVACPAGYDCNVQCDTDGACFTGVDCSAATSCKVECSGLSSCGTVTCGAGACNVTCGGLQSCMTVDCKNSCSCEVECPGPQSCQSVSCTALSCASGSGCTTSAPACHTCM